MLRVDAVSDGMVSEYAGTCVVAIIRRPFRKLMPPWLHGGNRNSSLENAPSRGTAMPLDNTPVADIGTDLESRMDPFSAITEPTVNVPANG